MESDAIWRVTNDANDSKRSCSSEARPSKSIYESDSRPGVRLCTIEDEFENYDVFISHRGHDTKMVFVGYLYEALKRIGLRPFLDCISISKGRDAWKCIDHAIKTTPIALVIFSYGFIQSEWCLKELHAMLATPSMKVLPIFYDVEPWKVRFPKKGQLTAGFAKLIERHDMTVTEEWRTDLKRASKLSGWKYKASDKRLEKDLALEVVDKVFELSNKPLPLDVCDHIVGVKKVVEYLIKTIDEKKVLILGLLGMGGIGKSTLARELYNQLGQRFDARCYVEDVVEKVKKGSVTTIQNHILKALCENESMQNIVGELRGKVILEERLSLITILLVLDDVHDHDQMDYLLSRKMLKEGSICIVTSRNRRTFEKSTSFHANHDVYIHDVQLLSQQDSRSLFAYHAFGGDRNVPPRFEGLVGNVSMVCGGVPLVLKVSGSLLKDEEDVEIWVEVLEQLKVSGSLLRDEEDEEIWEEVLKQWTCSTIVDEGKIFECPWISYDSLLEQHQEIFLDITCILVEASAMMENLVWRSESWSVAFGVRSLVEKALIRVDAKGAFGMHNHLQNMNFAIGWQESKREGFDSLALLNKNELGTSLVTVSSSLPSAKVQDDFEASPSVVSIEDNDSKSEDFMEFCNITKWIIYGDLQERTLLCFFNVEEKQYEFYFEDHESMATIIGLGVPHSKVVLECESHHVIVVEISEEDWDVVWANSNFIPLSIPKGCNLVQENFPNILHHIANIINIDKIVSKANDGGVGGDNGKGKAQGNIDDGKGKSHDHDEHRNTDHPNEGSSGDPGNNDKKEWKGRDENDDKKDGHDQNDVNTSSDGKEVKVEVFLRLLPRGILEEKGKKEELGEVCEEGEKMDLKEVHEEEGKKIELGEVHEEEKEKMELEEILEEEEEEKKEEEGFEAMDKKKRKNKYWKSFLDALKRCKTCDVENQQGRAMIEEVENGKANENLRKQVENQIHIKMVFSFTIKDEAGERSKTIQATILPITFQLPSYNEKNYLQSGRFGWFHDYLKVAFGVVDSKVAYLDEESCKVIEPSEAKKVNLRGNAKGNAKSSINAFKGKVGIKHGVFASGEYDRTNGSEAKTSEEVQNTWETNQRLIEGGFCISEVTDNSRQLKYVCRPLVPFDEEEFEVKDERGRLMEYHQNPICQLQRVRCQGTWQPYDSESLEEYELEVSRELEMTRVFKLDLETREEKKKKEIWKVEKNLPLCCIQKLKRVVYLNHGMSHLTSSGKYCLQEKQNQSDPSTSLTQGQYNKAPVWPSSIPLVDVNQ